MVVKYIPINLYEGQVSLNAVSYIEYVANSSMPLVIAESNEEFNAIVSINTTTLELFEIALANYPFFIPAVVTPAFFFNDDSRIGYNAPELAQVEPLPNVPYFPVISQYGGNMLFEYFPSGDFYVPTLELRENFCQIPSEVAYGYDNNGIRISSGFFRAAANNNTTGIRAMYEINVVERIDGIYTGRAKTVKGSITSLTGRNSRLTVSSYTLSDTLKFLLNNGYIDLEDDPIPPEPPSGDDPYGPTPGGPGYSGSGGGPSGAGGTGATGTGGLHDDTSDAVPTPSLPSSISTGSGLFTAYNPDVGQLADFARNLWNADVTLMGGDLFKLLFGGDAFNAIIGLHLLPVKPDTSSPINIKLGNWDSGASAPKITNQYVQVPFGSLMLPEYWGNSIDYSPYTRIQLALPYIGIVDVDTDDVLGSNNTLTYNIDVLSGALCATLHCVKGNLSSVIYQWSGSCAVSLPITGASFNAVMGAIMGIGAAIVGGVALASGPVGAAIGTAGIGIASTALGVGAAGNVYGSIKGKVQKSGAFGANSGALGIMTPYFIVTRPVQSVPETWQADKGYPANISAQLGTVSGYTEVSEINLECSGTEAEKKEIIDLLKKGVLF